MKGDKSANGNDSFLFSVDILVQADTNGEALERLLHVLNGGDFADFRVGSGIQLGQVIEDALAKSNAKPSASPPAAADKAKVAAAVAKAKDAVAKAKSGPNDAASASKQPSVVPQPDDLEKRIRQYIENNKLIRLNVNKGRGVKLSIPCRVISFDAANQLMTVYHVDEKQVHSFKLFEIDDFVE